MINLVGSARKKCAVAFSVLLVVMCLVAPRLRATNGPTPYTATLQETSFKGGVAVGEAQTAYTIAMRSDGSRVYLHKESPSSGNSKLGRTINFSGGIEVTVDDANSLMSTLRRPFDWRAIALDPGNNCLTSVAGADVGFGERQVVGKELIHGYRAVKIEDRAHATTYWFAVDYGCAMVQSRWKFGDGFVSEQQLVALTPGEPDPNLFIVSSKYREVLPSQVLCGSGGCRSEGNRRLLSLDNLYREQNQAARPK